MGISRRGVGAHLVVSAPRRSVRGGRSSWSAGSAGPRARGEVFVEPRTDEPERRFAAAARCAARRRQRLADASPASRDPLARAGCVVRFEEIPDRDRRRGRPRHRARRRGRRRTSARRTRRSSTTTSWSGCASRPPTGDVVGELDRIEHNAAQDLLVIRTPEREVLVPFVTALVPEVDVRRRPDRRRRPARACSSDEPEPMRDRRRHDLPRLPRAARALAARQGAARAACSTCASTTCATGPTTGTAPSTTRPYGGGAGMVMKPEPWGEALDAVAPTTAPTLVVPDARRASPFTQAVAAELATREHLVFACGRYEGIDQRVIDDARDADGGARALARRLRAQRRRGRRAGDHRGRRAAAARVHGQRRVAGRGVARATACSSTPSTPSPPRWRGHDVPDVLLSGDHARIAAWRHDQSVRRTAERRPDLRPRLARGRPRAVAAEIALAAPADAGELLTLQRACWVQEQQANPGVAHPAAARGPRRRAGAGSATGRRSCCAAAAGWSAPCAAGWTARTLGHRPADGRPRPAGTRAWAGCCSSAIEAAAPDEATGVRAVHRCRAASATSGSTRRRATGCAARPATRPGAVRLTKRRRGR